MCYILNIQQWLWQVNYIFLIINGSNINFMTANCNYDIKYDENKTFAIILWL